MSYRFGTPLGRAIEGAKRRIARRDLIARVARISRECRSLAECRRALAELHGLSATWTGARRCSIDRAIRRAEGRLVRAQRRAARGVVP